VKYSTVRIATSVALGTMFAMPVRAQEVLPFPPKPSGSIAERTMQESIYSPLPAVNRLPKQQFPVKDLEVRGGAIRGDRRHHARQKGERATVNSLETVAG
jgi:hypothetical protein